MPKILGQDEQQRALREIRSSLKDLGAVNKFLQGHNVNGMYQISFTDSEGARLCADLFCDNKDDIDIFVMGYKERVKTHILELAERNRIALDEEDNSILGIPNE